MVALAGLNTSIICLCLACVVTEALMHVLQPEGGLVQTWKSQNVNSHWDKVTIRDISMPGKENK